MSCTKFGQGYKDSLQRELKHVKERKRKCGHAQRNNEKAWNRYLSDPSETSIMFVLVHISTNTGLRVSSPPCLHGIYYFLIFVSPPLLLEWEKNTLCFLFALSSWLMTWVCLQVNVSHPFHHLKNALISFVHFLTRLFYCCWGFITCS